MNDLTCKRALFHLIMVLVLSILLGLLVDALFVVLLPTRSSAELTSVVTLNPPEREYHPIDEEVDYWGEITYSGLLTRTIYISATTTSITFDFGLVVTDTHDIVEATVAGEVNRDPQAFINAAFGEVLLGNDILPEQSFQVPSWNKDPSKQLFELHLTASEGTGGYYAVRIDRGANDWKEPPNQDRLWIVSDGVYFTTLDPTPEEASSNQIFYYRSWPEEIVYLKFTMQSSILSAESTPSKPIVHPSRRVFLQKLGDIIDYPFLHTLLFSLIEALPLLLFLWIVLNTTKDKHPFVYTLFKVVICLLTYHFTLYITGDVAGGYANSSLINQASEGLAKVIASYFSPRTGPLLLTGAYSSGVIILGVLLPTILFQKTSQDNTYPLKNFFRILGVITILALCAGFIVPVLYWFDNYSNYDSAFLINGIPLWTLILVVSSALAGLICIALRALYRKLAFRSPQPGTILIALYLIIGSALFRVYSLSTESGRSLEPTIWFFLTTALGAVLLYSLISVLLMLVQAIVPGFALSRRYKQLLLVGAFLSAAPMGALVSPTSPPASQFDIFSLAYQLDNFIIFIWLAGIAWLLFIGGQEGPKIGTLTRTLGILGASSLLFNYTARWLYIPITFLVGLLLLSVFLRRSEYLEKLGPFFEQVVAQRVNLLERIINLNIADKAYRDIRKNLSKKLSNGDISIAQLDSQVMDRRKQLEKAHQEATIQNISIKELALTFGPYKNAWDNGLHGVKWGFLFALPWLILYLRDFLGGPVTTSDFPLWNFANDLLNITGKWTALGFVLGYFYPYLRGKNGLQKGLGLFLVTVLPTLPLAVLSNVTSADWQATVFWSLQVFIHCMLLGLVAFDYMTLRQGYRDWQMLFEVHGIPSIGISVSSILAAAGATIVALLSARATDLVGMALKFIIPQVPIHLLPK